MCSMNDYTLGPLEQDVMTIVWQKKRACVQDVLQALHTQQNGPALAYTTVMTIMTRLFEKGLLKREKDGRCYYYQPRNNKIQYLHQLARRTMALIVENYGEEAVAAFVSEAGRLSHGSKRKTNNTKTRK